MRVWLAPAPGTSIPGLDLGGHDRHEVVHMLGADVMREVWHTMRGLKFGIEDARGFEEAREALLDEHRQWLTGRGLTEDDWVADQLLHFKWGYQDGHLGRWRVADLDEIFLHLFPRKVIVDTDDLPDVLPAAGRFLEFLADKGALAPDSDPLTRLFGALEGLTKPFLAEMRDRAGFGIAKSLFTGMADEGVDFTDPKAVDAWLADFNARPFEERDGLLPRPGAEAALPPMALPSDDVLAAEALETPVMQQLASFLAWVGDGRALTQRSNLKLADGKELVGLLGTKDRFNETIGDRTFKTHSTTDLPGVDLVFRLALKARLARKHRGTVRRTKRAGGLAGDSLGVWRDAVLAMLDLGLINAGREHRYGLRWWAGDLEEDAAGLLCALAVAAEPMPASLLKEAAFEALSASYDLDSMPDAGRNALPDSVAWGVGVLVDRLAWLGAVTRQGDVVETDRWGLERRTGGEVALTDLGRWFVRPILRERGCQAPGTGGLARASAAELLDTVAAWPPEAAAAEIRAWVAARDTAVDELVTVAREAVTPDQRALALDALEAFGEEAEPAVRTLLDDPRSRPLAALWLVNLGLEKPEFLEPEDTPAAFVQALAVTLMAGGPEAVPEAFEAHADVDQQVAMLEHLWRVDDPYTEPVLEALSGAPQRLIAKAARKALFRHRSGRR
ncbi:MAG: hypothetical protein ACRDZ4_19885 [Egibacteraceae bacterium]